MSKRMVSFDSDVDKPQLSSLSGKCMMVVMSSLMRVGVHAKEEELVMVDLNDVDLFVISRYDLWIL